jgi:hypothetical protein
MALDGFESPPARGPFLLILIALAGGVRVWGLGAHGLWLDELLSLSSAQGAWLAQPLPHPSARPGLDKVVEAALVNDSGNGIGYVLLLRAWVSIAGAEDAAVRLLSVLFSADIFFRNASPVGRAWSRVSTRS